MNPSFPTAEEYSAAVARHPARTVVDLRAEAAAVTATYQNQVLLDNNAECLRLSVVEGEYHWHHHPDSDELFLVVAGELQIDFADGQRVALTEWQSLVVPAGPVPPPRAAARPGSRTIAKKGAAAGVGATS